MVKILDIDRTATFAISNHNLPYLATANVAGAIDVDFSDSSKLEIWNAFDSTNKTQPIYTVDIDAKVYDMTWSADNKLLVGGLENGLINFWNGDALLNNDSNVVLHSATNHTSAVRSLAFNHSKPNVLLSGSANSEIFIWDTNKLSADPLTPTGEPYSGNDKSGSKKSIEEINSLSWNHIVSHIFASASNTGITSIWDLKSKRKVLNLSYTASTSGGNVRANLSSVAWHPTQSTKLITSSDLDDYPVVTQWDLRFSKTPELIFGGPSEFSTNKDNAPGHSKGILSLDWLAQDSDFLLTSGKDSNTFLWDTKTGAKIASYPLHNKASVVNAIGSNSSSDWVFKSRFAGKNPEYFASSTFEGKVILQTLQDTSSNKPKEVDVQKETTTAQVKKETSETDFWNQISTEDNLNSNDDVKEDVKPEIYIKKAPKWLSRPTSVSFAFGGKLVFIKTTKDAENKEVSVVEIAKAKLNNATETDKSVKNLTSALSNDEESIKSLIKEKSLADSSFEWKLLSELKTLDNDKKKLLQRYISPEETKQDVKEEEDVKDESAKTGDDAFFSNLAEETSDEEPATAVKPYKPSGEFKIFSSEDTDFITELKKRILAGEFSKAVTIALENGKVMEALVLALNSKDESLKQKVLGHYFEEHIDKKQDSLARLLYSTSNLDPQVVGSEKSSETNVTDDLVSNASVEHWQEIALGISTYVKDETSFNAKITELGDRVYESGSRDNALLLYFIGGSLNKISDIWFKELESKEKDIVNTKSSDNHESLLDIYYALLEDFIVKVLIFKNSLGITSVPNTDNYKKLIKIFLDYIDNIGDNYGNFDLVEKLLNVLPADLSDVELEKARIGKGAASTTATTTTAATTTTTTAGRGKYGANRTANKYGASSSVYGSMLSPIPSTIGLATPPAPVSTGPKKPSRYVAPPQATPFGQPQATSPAANAYAPKTNGYTPSSATASPYTPHSALNPTNGFSNNLAAPPTARYSSSQNPSGKKKNGHEGWNDLPDSFAGVTSKATKRKAAPVNVAPAYNSAPGSQSPSQPPFSRNASFSAPPPPKASARNSAVNSPRIANANLHSPVAVPPPPPNKYAPPPSSINTQPKFGQIAPPPSGLASPPPVNPYAPSPVPFDNGLSNFANNTPYGKPAFKSSTPSAVGPPPIGGRQFNNSPAPSFQPPQSNSPYAPPQGNAFGQINSAPQLFTPGPPPVRGPPTAAESIAAQAAQPASNSSSLPPPPVSKPKQHPAGDRSHIPQAAQPVFQILSNELATVIPKIPAKYAKKTADTEKRVNNLFDQLNNGNISSEVTGLLLQLSNALAAKDYANAHSLHLQIATNHSGETGTWLMGVKRLIDMVEVTDDM